MSRTYEQLEPVISALDNRISASAAQIATNTADITELKEEFTDIGVTGGDLEEITLTTEQGYYINGKGVITSTGGNYELCKCSVVAGKTYYVSGCSNFSSPYYAFYDSEMTLVQIGSASADGSAFTHITDEKVVAPVGAKIIAVQQVVNVYDASVKEKASYTLPELDNLASSVSNIQSVIGTIIEKTETVQLINEDGYYITKKGVITSASGNYIIRKGSVVAGDKYYITASTNWSNAYYAFYADDDSLVQVGTISPDGSAVTNIINEEVVAPEGSSYIAINWITSGNMGSATHYIGQKIAGKWYGKKWACVGDSLTDDNQYTNQHYFDYVAEATDIEPINMGDSGTGYKRGYDSNRAFYQRISAIDTTVDVVTIFGSFNDIGAGYTLGEYTDTGTTTIAGCINTTIDNLQAVMPTAILGIIAPTPWATARPDFHTNADNYVNMLQKIAEHRSIPFLDLFRASNLRPWDDDFKALCYSNDGGNGVHPNELGHKIIAPKFKAFLESLLI